jgi:DNA invertase Pin-like site-specific DNA recombinase
MGRISTPQQQMSAIEASYVPLEHVLKEIYDGPPPRIRCLGEQASGMKTDRTTLLVAYELIESGWPDLVIAEDLSRIFRNPRWLYAFVQDCVDARVRLIAPGDNFDTTDENWELALSIAALRHGMHITDTRRRVGRSSRHPFEAGGMVGKVRFGYRKLSKEEAATGQASPVGLRIARRDELTWVYDHLWTMVVDERKGGPDLAQWLEAQQIELPPYVRTCEDGGRWIPKLVLDTLRDPIVAGFRTFQKTIHRTLLADGSHERDRNARLPVTSRSVGSTTKTL